MPAIKLPSWLPFPRKAAETSGSSAIGAAQRDQQAMGPWTSTLSGYVARQISPALFEALREALPILDGAINTMVTLDGIVRVEGDDEALVAEIRQWMETVRVNDAEAGLQAFYASQGGEIYEQGAGVGEWTARKDGKGIERLRVADSKGVMFVRDGDTLRAFYRAPSATSSGPGGLDTVESVLRGTGNVTVAALLEKDYREIDPRRMVYAVNQPEADNPYGTSMLRSLEFTTQVMLRIQNALGRAWTRWGDPPLHMTYRTKNARITETQLENRRKILAQELATALQAKEKGNSIDLVTATGMLDEITVAAIGAASVALDPTAPIKHITEQVCAKFGLPPWLLGVDGTVGAGQAERQAEMVLQSSKTRFERRKPGLEALVATHLRLAGKTWAPGAWKLVQELPNLQDMMKIAQAEFLHAQAAMVGGGNGTDDAPRGIDNNLRGAASPRGKRTRRLSGTKAGGDDDSDGEPWAEDDAELPRIEQRRIRAALTSWRAFAAAAAAVLGFEVVRNTIRARGDADAWIFPRERTPDLLVLAQRFIIDNSADEAPVLGASWDAWVRGAQNAAGELSVAAEIARFHDLVRTELRTRGGALIRNAFARAWQDRILSEMAAGAWDGMNPVTVAAALQRKFGAGEYDWERLVRSEMAIAQSRGKRAIYAENGMQRYDYTTAGDDRVSAICLALADGGPYDINDPQSPVPVLSSHPNCFPAGTPVLAPNLRAVSTRRYEGQFVEVITTSGNQFTVTPNHPILTPNGWVAAGLLVEGDHVIRYGVEVDGAYKPHDAADPTPIEQVAESFRASGSVTTVCVPTAAVDFHGDGMQADVDVVDAVGLLQDAAGDATGIDGGTEFPLGIAHMQFIPLHGEGAFGAFLPGAFAAANGGIGGDDIPLPLGSGQPRHADDVCFTAGTDGNPVQTQETTNRRPTDAQIASEAENAFSELVARDEIIGVRNFHGSHMVYNLETDVGWYVAGGVVVHNCRCSIAPHIAD